jgi:hypothetical protein
MSAHSAEQRTLRCGWKLRKLFAAPLSRVRPLLGGTRYGFLLSRQRGAGHPPDRDLLVGPIKERRWNPFRGDEFTAIALVEAAGADDGAGDSHASARQGSVERPGGILPSSFSGL